MAHTMSFYRNTMKMLGDGVLDLKDDTLKVMLVSPSYTFNENHVYVDDGGGVSPEDYEINKGQGATNGYESGFSGSGRKTLASKTWAAISGAVKWDADDLTWTTLAGAVGNVAYCIVWKPQTDDTDSELICCFDFDPDATPDGSDFQVQFHADGLGNLRNV